MTKEVKVGTIGFDVDSKKKISPKYQFNTAVTVPVVGTEVIGGKERVIVLVEGKRISVPK